MENTVTYALHKPCMHRHGNTHSGDICAILVEYERKKNMITPFISSELQRNSPLQN